MRYRLRLGIAALLVMASLIAVAASLKSATCDCGSSGLPWETIAIAATIVALTSGAAYAILAKLAPAAD